MTSICIEQGDLTGCEVDAIVNAANNDLTLGGGLAGAIRRRGGPSIQIECDRHGSVRVGQAALTGAGDMPARYVVHQASMALGGRTSAKSLTESTRAVLAIAEKTPDIHTLAFPAVGTGIAGFSLAECAKIMLTEAMAHIQRGSKLREIRFVLFDDAACRVFRTTFEAMGGGQ